MQNLVKLPDSGLASQKKPSNLRKMSFSYFLVGVLVFSLISQLIFKNNLLMIKGANAIMLQICALIFFVFFLAELTSNKSLILLCSLGLFLFIGFRGSFDLIDDTFISLRYAENFSEGNGLVFNIGEKVEGYTCFLWVFLLGLLQKLVPALDLVPLSKYLGVLWAVLAVLLIYRFSLFLHKKAHDNSNIFSEYAPLFLLLLATNLPFVFWSFTGMEVSLYLFLLLGGCYFFCNYLRDPEIGIRRLVVSGVFFALALLTRPETYLLVFPCLLFIIHVERKGSFKRLIIFSLPLSALFLPYFIWRYSYYGFLFPNTYYAKVGALSNAILLQGLTYLKKTSIPYLFFIIPVAIKLFRKNFLVEREEVFLLSVLLLQVLSILLTGADHFRVPRYFVFMMPFLYLFSIDEISRLVEFSGRALSRFWTPGAAFLKKQVLGILSIAVFVLFFQYDSWGLISTRIAGQQVKIWKLLGDWLEANTNNDDLIASPVVGAVAYYSDRNIVDMLGLTDEVIAHTIVRPGEGPRDHERFNTDYLMSRKPKYIFLFSNAHNEQEFLNSSSWIPALEDLKRYFPNKEYEFVLVNIKDQQFALYRRNTR